ncbi:MAG: HTH-type transcriptional regulator MetR [Rhodospirillaceae bacterium]|nr:MAG: HTH-type transcriptional regulator MetR [Rhodospirillaceae bacterium]
MNIELKHLRTILAIHKTGSLQRATEQLNMTQSAISHQLRYIREQIGVELFVPETRPLKLSPEGLELIEAAERILSEVDKLKSRFVDLRSGQTGRMFIAIECHACFEWLFPVLNLFRDHHSNVDVDIKPGLAFKAIEALQNEEVDLVISADLEELAGIEFHELFTYEPIFIASRNHPLSKRPYIDAEDFADQNIITYPVPKERLDLFNLLLLPAGIEPLSIRQIELTSVILLLVSANKGVSVLPDWVLQSSRETDHLTQKRLTKKGTSRKLYAAVRRRDSEKLYIKTFLSLSKNILSRLST